jgi:hypothetical protein
MLPVNPISYFSHIQQSVICRLTPIQKKVMQCALGAFIVFSIGFCLGIALYKLYRVWFKAKESELNKKTEEQQEFEKQVKRIDEVSARILRKIDPQQVPNYFAMHIMMDKLFISHSEYEGGVELASAREMLTTLTELKKNQWKMNEESAAWVSSLTSRLHAPLTSLIELEELRLQHTLAFWNKTENEPLKQLMPNISKLLGLVGEIKIKSKEDFVEIYIAKIMQLLGRLSDGQLLLIPLGCQKHATLLCVRKIHSLFRLEHYNTGLGLPSQHKWPDAYLFQTYQVIDQVPEDSILNEEAWKKIISLQDEKNMDAAHQWLQSTIGKGGTVLPCSVNIEDYEMPQFSNTCPTQSLMAFIRYEAMQMAKGTPSEKEAFYKLFKTCLFLQYLQNNKSKLDRTITLYLPPMLAQLEAEQKLMQIALDESQFIDSLKIFKEVFTSLGESKVFEATQLPPDATFLARYAHLRFLSIQLCNIWWANRQKRDVHPSKHPALELAHAKFEKYVTVEKNIVPFLARNKNSQLAELCFILSNTRYKDVGTKEALKYLKADVVKQKEQATQQA